ncbi:MAG: HlyD family secretion protein [Sphingobium sp.]|nr:HlyD family secretion protein [Sphingobium sp.]
MAEADPALNKAQRVEATPVAVPDAPAPKRRWGKTAAMLVVPLAVVVGGGYAWMTSGRSVTTDNAYVKRDISSVGSDVAGRIVDVRVRENQMVKQGDILFLIDQAPFKVTLAQANAAIANAQVTIGKLREDYSATNADIEGAKSDLYFAEEDLKRQQALMDQGFTTRTRFQQSQQAVATAQKVLNNARSDAAKAQAALATGSQVPGVNPQIAAAQAQRAQAELNLERTVVRAPISGRASQTERLQVGQMAVQGLPLVSIVASEKSWITANFKETDLDKMCPGQPADIKLDAYPDLKLKGHVSSIGGGTGSQFSILPAQNANGNWVKVTQRVPVRIDIDGTPSRTMIAGLSAKVTVKFTGCGAGGAAPKS